MAECPNPIRLRPTLEDLQTGAVFPGEAIFKSCGRWACDVCGPKRRIEVLKLIEAGVDEAKTKRPSDPIRLLTITFPTDLDLRLDDGEDLKEANQRMRRFIEDIRRKLNLQFEYIKVIEATKRGRIHIHLVCWGDRLPKCTPKKARRRDITGKAAYECYCEGDPCIQRIAHHHGLGFVDIRAAWKPRDVIRYVAKYLTKSIRYVRWPRYGRRTSASRRFAPTTLGEIHRQWVEQVLATLEDEDNEDDDRQLVVVAWEFVPPIRRPHLPPISRAERGPPLVPEDAILDPATGHLLPIPF